MKKWLLIGLGFLAGCSGKSEPQPIFLGHVATLSGPERHAGEQAALGYRLALADKKWNEVDGRPLAIRHTDTRGHLEAFEAQAVRLAAVNKVGIVFGGATPAEVLRLDRSRMPILTPLGSRPTGAGDQVFCLGLAPSFQGKVLGGHALKRWALLALLGLAAPVPSGAFPEPSIVIVKDETSEEAEQVVAAFTSALGKEESRPAVPVLVLSKERRWEDLARTVLNNQPACVLFAASAQDFMAFLPHLPTPGPLLLYGGPDGSLNSLPMGKEIITATAFSSKAKRQEIRDFVEQFRSAFNTKTDPDVHAALAYEGLLLLSRAMRKATEDETSPLAELRALKGVPGLSGPLSLGAGQCVSRPAWLVRRDGSAEIVLEMIEP